MPKASDKPLARRVQLQLIHGRSDVTCITFDARMPATRLEVGAHVGCGWRVEADGILDHHFVLVWDGHETLHIEGHQDALLTWAAVEVKSRLALLTSGVLRFAGATLRVQVEPDGLLSAQRAVPLLRSDRQPSQPALAARQHRVPGARLRTLAQSPLIRRWSFGLGLACGLLIAGSSLVWLEPSAARDAVEGSRVTVRKTQDAALAPAVMEAGPGVKAAAEDVELIQDAPRASAHSLLTSVEALSTGRLKRALRLYRASAKQDKDQPAIAALIRILEKRVRSLCAPENGGASRHECEDLP